SLNVSAKDLAVMGATLADGGMNPLTRGTRGRRHSLPLHAGIDDDRGTIRDLRRLALRYWAAWQERNQGWGRHLVPGKGGLGTFAPPLDSAGNSVKGQLIAKFLSQRLGMDLFVSEPEKSHGRTR